MQNDMKQTAIHLASMRGHAHVVKALVAEGAEVMQIYLAFMMCFCIQTYLVKALVAEGAKVYANILAYMYVYMMCFCIQTYLVKALGMQTVKPFDH